MKRRIFLVLGLTTGLVLLTPGVASAHNVGSIKATNYHSVLDAVSPVIPGVTVKVEELGNKVEVTNATDTDLVILGYQSEPYIRVSKQGVFTNQNSPAYYTNQSLNGTTSVVVPPGPLGPPDWHKTSSGDVAIWHDHRTHWMAGIDPPDVRAHPNQSHVVIPQWTIAMTYANQPVTATGHLTWMPAPNPFPWFALAVAAFALGLAAGFGKYANINLAIALLVLVAIDVAHTVGQVLEFTGSAGSIAGRAGPSILPSVAAWIVGVYAAKKIAASTSDGPWFGLFAALIIGLLGGVSDLDTLTRSQVPLAWNPNLARVLVSTSAGLGLGISVSLILLIRRERAITPEPEPITPGT